MSNPFPRHVTPALVLSICLTTCVTASAFSIGALNVHTLTAGEPLDAEIPLFFEDYENPQFQVSASLLPADDYPAGTPPPPPFLDAITIERAENRLRLSTTAALTTDALVHLPPDGWGLLIRADRMDGASITHLYRLRPPASTATVTSLTEAELPAPTVSDDTDLGTAPPFLSTRSLEPAPAALRPRPHLEPGEAIYGPVKAGDSLYRVATYLGFRGDNTWLAAYALWQRNVTTGAFVRNNIHGLRAGAVLAIPSDLATRIQSYDPAVVQLIAARHVTAWRDGRTLPATPATPRPLTTDDSHPDSPTRPEPSALPSREQKLPAATHAEPASRRPVVTPPTTAAMTYPAQELHLHAPDGPPVVSPSSGPLAQSLPADPQSFRTAAPADEHPAVPQPVPEPPAASPQSQAPSAPHRSPDSLVAALQPLDAYLSSRFGATHVTLSPTEAPAEGAGATAILAAAVVTCLVTNGIVCIRRRRLRKQQPEN